MIPEYELTVIESRANKPKRDQPAYLKHFRTVASRTQTGSVEDFWEYVKAALIDTKNGMPLKSCRVTVAVEYLGDVPK